MRRVFGWLAVCYKCDLPEDTWWLVRDCKHMSEVECPKCGDAYSRRGLHGHLEHGHEIPHEQAMSLAESAKQQKQAPTPSQPTSKPERRESGDMADVRDDADELDRVLDQIAKNAERRSKIAAVSELSGGGRSESGSGEERRSPVEDFQELISAVEKIESLRSDGDDDGSDGGLSREDIRQIVREESRTPALDGGESADPIAAAIESGVTDPDDLRALAEVSGHRSRWSDLAERALAGEFDVQLGEILGGLGRVVSAATAGQPQAQQAQQQAQSASTGSKTPDVEGPPTATDRDTDADADADAEDGGEDK